MMTLDEAMAKATKLLKLAESANPHEAALAAQRAQEILTRYDIDKAALSMDAGVKAEPEESIENFRDRPLDAANQRLSKWKLILSSRVAKANSCRVYQSGNLIGIIGRASDVEKVRYMYDMLIREIDRLTDRDGKGMGKNWRTEYRYGAVAAIGDKLAEARQKVAEEMRAENTGTALVRVNNAIAAVAAKDQAVDAWVKDNMRLRNSTHRVNPNYAARQAGYQAGRTINLGARADLPSGGKRLR